MNSRKRNKIGWTRLLRLAMMGMVALGSVLLVTAGTVRETVTMPPPAANLQEMLDRVDGATAVIARQLSPSAVSTDWEAATVDKPVAGPEVAVAAVVEEEHVATEAMESIRKRVETLTLDGIAWNEKTPVAFVNRKTLVIDAEIEDLRVVFIGPDSVVLEDERGHTQELRLPDYSHLLQAKKD